MLTFSIPAGTLINLTSPHKHFEMINSINQMDQNVNVVNNLLRAAQGKSLWKF
jgi:hypothetical protein